MVRWNTAQDSTQRRRGIAELNRKDAKFAKTSHTKASQLDTDLVLSIYEADDGSKTNAQAITQDCEIHADDGADTSSDVLVRRTAATTYTIDTGTNPNQVVVIEVPTDELSDDKPCCYLSDSGRNASNDCTIFWVGVPPFAGETLGSAIVEDARLP